MDVKVWRKHRFVAEESFESVQDWLTRFGGSDFDYMQAHWPRFTQTKDFALAAFSPREKLTVIDIGAHWLHNAFLYANRHHSLICVDGPNTFAYPSVQKVAEAIDAKLILTRRLELLEEIASVSDDSVDLVLFCEIIEHLAFNPIPMWKQIYRVMKPGGRIVITTPNANYHRVAAPAIDRALAGQGIGPAVDSIFKSGTFGHHWKEFTLDELRHYFAVLSPDFNTDRHMFITHPHDENVPLSATAQRLPEGANVRAHNIYLDVKLTAKEAGIVVSPPWIVTY